MEAIVLIIILPVALTLLCVGATMIGMLALRTLIIGQMSGVDARVVADKVYWTGMIVIPFLMACFALPTVGRVLHLIAVQTLVTYGIVLRIGLGMKSRIDNGPGNTALQRMSNIFPPEPEGSAGMVSRSTLLIVFGAIVAALILQIMGVKLV